VTTSAFPVALALFWSALPVPSSATDRAAPVEVLAFAIEDVVFPAPIASAYLVALLLAMIP
jgi:hypothetical protein